MSTCRFCKKMARESDLVKYGVRHYAHADCYLEAGKPLGALSGWQIRNFPDGALMRAGILDEKERLVRTMNLLGNG